MVPNMWFHPQQKTRLRGFLRSLVWTGDCIDVTYKHCVNDLSGDFYFTSSSILHLARSGRYFRRDLVTKSHWHINWSDKGQNYPVSDTKTPRRPEEPGPTPHFRHKWPTASSSSRKTMQGAQARAWPSDQGMHQCPLYWLADEMISTNIKFWLLTDFDPSQFSLECSHCTQPSAIGQNSIPKQTASNGEMTIPKSLPVTCSKNCRILRAPWPTWETKKVGTRPQLSHVPHKTNPHVPWMISCYIDFCHFTLHRLVSCSAGARWNWGSGVIALMDMFP